MKSTITALASLLTVSHAMIHGITIPSTIQPGDPFDVTIESSLFSQSIYDVAIVFGYAQDSGYPGGVGEPVKVYGLGSSNSNQENNFTRKVSLPKHTPHGKGVFAASLFSLIGASNTPTIQNLNITIEVGDTTSTKSVSTATWDT